MTPFTGLETSAAWLDEDNIDTDAILPARFLLLLEKGDFGRHLFHDRRHGSDGKPQPGFVLDQPEYEDARILLGRRNFGCGSSREHAVWAIEGHGLRCVIAISFGEIFHANCLKNGILPITVTEEAYTVLLAAARRGDRFRVDLARQRLHAAMQDWTISLPDDERQALLNGWDEVERILQMHGDDITTFEARHRAAQPWLFNNTI